MFIVVYAFEALFEAVLPHRYSAKFMPQKFRSRDLSE